MRRGFTFALLAGVVLYAALGWTPLFWTFGKALVQRGPELGALFASGAAWKALARSAALGGLAAGLSLILAAPLALLTGRSDLPGSRALSLLAVLPLALPPYVIALALRAGLPPSLLGAGVVLALGLYPVAFLFLRAGLASVDPALEEAAVLARGELQTLRRITWPLLKPWAAAALGIVFLLGLGEFGTPALLGVPVYPGLIALRFSATYDAAGAAAAAVPLLAVVLAVLLVESALLSRTGVFAVRLKAARLVGLGGWRLAATLLVGAIVFASPVVPVLALVRQLDAPGVSAAFRLAWRPFLNTVSVAAAGALAASVVGLALALLARDGWRLARGVSLVFFVLPGAVLGVALISFWNRPHLPPLYGTLGLVVIALALRYTVLTERAIAAGFRLVPRSQEEVARLCGRSELSITWRILLPQAAPAVLAGALAFVLFSIRDLDTVVTLYPPGGETLAVQLFTILANAPEGLQAALALAQVVLTLPVALLVFFISRRALWPQ